jgi:ribosomal protein S18 acetylase RimI-like enzyme
MEIFITNRLTMGQYYDITSLVEESAAVDGTKGISFLEQELNAIEEFPCYYMMYDGSRLVSYLSVFIPDEESCDIYSATLPTERGKGYFKTLLGEAMKHVREYGITYRCVVKEPDSKDMDDYLERLNAKLIDEDYLLTYDMLVKPEPKGILSLKYRKEENTGIYETFRDEKQVGTCQVEYSSNMAAIHNVEVKEEERGKGYGTETLLLVLNHLLEDDVAKIVLHVTGANEVAYNMYMENGFVEEQRIEYWKLV